MAVYTAGSRLVVDFEPLPSCEQRKQDGLDGSILGGSSQLHLEVMQAFQPFTMSAACQVRISANSGTLPAVLSDPSSTYVLKMYDRRHSNNLRTGHKSEWKQYTPAHEEAYRGYLADPSRRPSTTARAQHSAHNDPPPDYVSGTPYLMDCLNPTRDLGFLEAAVAVECKRMLEAELAAYEGLTALGTTRNAPRFFGRVTYDAGIAEPVRGLLIEYIDGVRLSDYLKAATPCALLTSVVRRVYDETLRLLEVLEGMDMMHKDLRADNVIVQLKPESSFEEDDDQAGNTPPELQGESLTLQRLGHPVRCVVIDFGQSTLRLPDETEEQWAAFKAHYVERDKIAVEMWYHMRAALGQYDDVPGNRHRFKKIYCPWHGKKCRPREIEDPLGRGWCIMEFPLLDPVLLEGEALEAQLEKEKKIEEERKADWRFYMRDWHPQRKL